MKVNYIFLSGLLVLVVIVGFGTFFLYGNESSSSDTNVNGNQGIIKDSDSEGDSDELDKRGSDSGISTGGGSGSSSSEEPSKQYPGIKQIVATHRFESGTHTFSGTVDMPTPCDSLSVDALLRESYPEQIVLQFTAQSSVDTSEIACAQVITPQDFSISVDAAKNATVSAELNGYAVELQLQ